MGEHLIELEDISVEYRQRRRRQAGARTELAVDGVSLTLSSGESLGLVGGTGSGKSSVAQVILGLVKPATGIVRIDGTDMGTARGRALRAIRQRVQVVMQDPYSSLDPRMRVRDIIAEPLRSGSSRLSRNDVDQRVDELLNSVALSHSKAGLYPHQFSGGQRQRIAIARALATHPELVILDEPTSALDVSVRAQILKLLKRLQKENNCSFLMISHDLSSIAYLATNIAVMYRGKIVEYGPATEIAQSPRHPYTQVLVASVPDVGGSFLRAGHPASAGGQGSVSSDALRLGCSYRSRCAVYAELQDRSMCEQAEPALAERAGSHLVACHEVPGIGLPVTPARPAPAADR